MALKSNITPFLVKSQLQRIMSVKDAQMSRTLLPTTYVL